jgi:hypothetical protein
MPEESNKEGQVTVDWRLDAGEVIITIKDAAGSPLAHARLVARQLDILIAGLGGLRSQMQPAITMDFPMGMQMNAELDPRWWTEPEPLTEGSTLVLRHSGFGWLAFVLPPAEVENIHRLLTRQKELPKSDQGPRH